MVILNILLLLWSPCLAIREISLTPGTVDKVILQANETVRLVSKGKPDPNEAFWTFEAHTHDNDDHITLYRDEETIGNVQLFVNLIFFLYVRWCFKIVCLQTKLAS